MKTFQIRDQNFGLALYDAESAREARLRFLADEFVGELRPDVEETEDGSAASVLFRGNHYEAVSGT